MRDKPYRSLLKTLSWRVTGTMDTIFIAYFITKDLSWAISIGFIEVFTKLALYYFHERIWDRLNIGRVEPPAYHI
jgi:uncharacterized membrane protein